MARGYGAMFSQAERVTPEDRWAIVAYLRALQLSQHAPLSAVPADKQSQLSIHAMNEILVNIEAMANSGFLRWALFFCF